VAKSEARLRYALGATRRREGETYVVDIRRRYAPVVGARIGNLDHDGGLHSRPSIGRPCCGARSGHSRPPPGLKFLSLTNKGKTQTMKLNRLLIIGATLLSLDACLRKETPSEKLKDNVDDALDRRPGEKIRDTVEDIKK